MRRKSTYLALLALFCCPAMQAQRTQDPFTQDPYRVMTGENDAKLLHVRSYCLSMEGGSDYPAHDATASQELRKDGPWLATLDKWRLVPRCTEADASVSVYIFREETRGDEDEGPTAFRSDVWVGLFIQDQHWDEKLKVLQKAGHVLTDEETKGLDILSVMGHGDETYTMEQLVAGRDTLQGLRDAVDEAVYGAARIAKEKRDGPAAGKNRQHGGSDPGYSPEAP